jgi:hypothetical protein
LKNGELLKTAEDEGLEVFITGDQTISYEQNLTGRRVAIVVLSPIDWHILKNHLPLIIAAIDSALPGALQSVDCGSFTRKKYHTLTFSQSVSFETLHRAADRAESADADTETTRRKAFPAITGP